MPCALLLSFGIDTRFGIFHLPPLWGGPVFAGGGGCPMVGWGAGMRNKGLNAGGAAMRIPY
jgi:hypothetical protein